MSAALDWVPLWLRLVLGLVGFLVGSIVAVAAWQAGKVLGAMALNASLRGLANLTDRLTRLFIDWGCALAQATAEGALAFARPLHAALHRRRHARRLKALWREEFREHFETFAAFREAFERTDTRRRPPPGSARPKPDPPCTDMPPRPRPQPPPPPPRKPPPDPAQAAFATACRMFGLPESGFTLDQLTKRYRACMHAAHPDRGGNHQRAAALNAARDLIKQRKGWTS